MVTKEIMERRELAVKPEEMETKDFPEEMEQPGSKVIEERLVKMEIKVNVVAMVQMARTARKVPEEIMVIKGRLVPKVVKVIKELEERTVMRENEEKLAPLASKGTKEGKVSGEPMEKTDVKVLKEPMVTMVKGDKTVLMARRA